MTDVFRDPTAGWAAMLVVLLPLVIIGSGELEERLRQRDSSLQRPIAAVRNWVLPLFAVWALVRVLFDASSTNPFVQLIASGLVVALGAAALAALAIVIDRIRDRGRDGRRSVPRLLLAFPRLVLILVLAWLLIAGVWDVDLSAAMTALGVTSLVVSFALQDTLGGIASGFTLLADQPFQPGDWIRADDVEGQVVDINWRSSRIQTRDGDLVVVPNGQLAGATITNFDEPTRLHRVVVPVQVAYVNSPTDAKAMLLAAAESTPGVLSDPPPNAVVVQIDDPLMGYEVQMWVDDYTIAPRVKSDFGSLVWYHSHRRGVPLPSPAQDLFLWDGERSAAVGERDRASLLRGLRTSSLLDQLGDDELDQLAGAAVSARYANGETILDPGDDDMVLIERGSAQLTVDIDGHPTPVLDLAASDLATSLARDEVLGHGVSVVAISDCDVITVRADAVGGAISRSVDLNAAVEQITSSRRRRVHRVVRRARLERDAADAEALVAIVDAEASPEPGVDGTAADRAPTDDPGTS